MKRNLVKRVVCLLVVASVTVFGPAVQHARAQGPPPVGIGLKGDYYDTKDFNSFKFSRTDATVDFDWGTGTPDVRINPDTFSIRWTGSVLPQNSETYVFYTLASDGVRLWVNGQLLIDDFVVHNTPIERSASIALTAGRFYDIKLEYFENFNTAQVKLSWESPSVPKAPIPQSQLFPATQADAARILEQASFGATETSINHVVSIGIDAWLDEQFAAAPTGYPDMPYYPSTVPADCDSICNRDNYSLFQVQLRFFQNAMYGEDQLRQRVAFALSQIDVVSGTDVNIAYGMTEYQQILFDNAFGNYRDILYQITLNPAMGRYLDMVNNDKPNPQYGIEPNENYARELMQLFSIGTYKLNLDGTVQTSGGVPVSAYDQETIEGFAHVFTGWTYPTLPGGTPARHNPSYYLGSMYLYPGNHDTGAKELLDGVILPARDDAYADLNAAIDNIFYNANVGPFISKQLIQKLVTSNPSPAYVARVATKFNDNGSGVRGDLKAVVRAILTDDEARNATPPSDFGHLKEPALWAIGVLRGLNGISDGVYLRGQVSAMGQNLFYSPSVFNYYPPDNPISGTTLVGPELAIHNSNTSLQRSNFINAIVFSNGIAPDPTVQNATGTSVNLANLQALSNDPSAMVDKLSLILMHGAMPAAMKTSIVNAVNVVPASDPVTRARTAAYLVATASQFQVAR
ncbi:MAG TPA: DUF1800 family protein [Blastocatellia bacterium]|nr:DUF1800 family protein [Blastocatellia bacterium]